MDEAERQALRRRLARLLKSIYLTSLMHANICASHARHVHKGELGERLKLHALELAQRREAAAALLAAHGRGRPISRVLIHPLTLLWGRATCLTGAQFSLHMLGNMEAQGARLTAYAEKLARELADVAATETLVKLARAEAARKVFIVGELENA